MREHKVYMLLRGIFTLVNDGHEAVETVTRQRAIRSGADGAAYAGNGWF